MWPVISLLGLTIPVGPLFALLSFYIGNDLGTRAIGRVAPAEQRTTWQTAFTNATFAALIAGLIGARLGYAARYFPIYLETPQLLLSIRPGALALLPGLIAGGAIGLLYLARKNIPTAPTSDAAAIGITVALAVLSLGRFLTGEGYGLPTAAPWQLAYGVRHATRCSCMNCSYCYSHWDCSGANKDACCRGNSSGARSPMSAWWRF